MKRITKIEAAKETAKRKLRKGNCEKETAKRKLRVAAPVKVPTKSDKQLVSLEAQKNHYENYIKVRPAWNMPGYILTKVSAARR